MWLCYMKAHELIELIVNRESRERNCHPANETHLFKWLQTPYKHFNRWNRHFRQLQTYFTCFLKKIVILLLHIMHMDKYPWLLYRVQSKIGHVFEMAYNKSLRTILHVIVIWNWFWSPCDMFCLIPLGCPSFLGWKLVPLLGQTNWIEWTQSVTFFKRI